MAFQWNGESANGESGLTLPARLVCLNPSLDLQPVDEGCHWQLAASAALKSQAKHGRTSRPWHPFFD